MSDIDEKLLAILSKLQGWSWSLGKDVIDMSDDGMAEECLVEIKQAFGEAGHVKHNVYPATLGQEPSGKSLLIDTTAQLMTGAEWYERFDKELTDMPCNQRFVTGDGADETVTVTHSMLQVKQAARRAAGLETEGRG